MKNGAKIILSCGTHMTGKTIIRFRKGRDALMRHVSSEVTPFGIRIYGINIMGDDHAAWAQDCRAATEEDISRWNNTKVDRTHRRECDD